VWKRTGQQSYPEEAGAQTLHHLLFLSSFFKPAPSLAGGMAGAIDRTGRDGYTTRAFVRKRCFPMKTDDALPKWGGKDVR